MADGFKILLSDSDKVIIELCKTLLRNSGLTVLECQNGSEAYEIIRTKRPHLAFLSAEMPIMNGVECCQAVKMDVSLQTTPIILMLSCGSMDNIETCRKAGCDDVVLKPISRKSLFSVVKKYIKFNKRESPRFEASIPVSWRLKDDAGHWSYTFDISNKGLFLQTDEKIDVGTDLHVELTLPILNYKIESDARVCWINHKSTSMKPGFPPGIGLEFFGLNEVDCGYLSEYIRKEHVEPILRRIM